MWNKELMFCVIFWNRYEDRWKNITVTRQHFVITHTICQQQSYKHIFCQCAASTQKKKKTPSSLYFCKNIKCLNFGLLRICQVFVLSPVKLCVSELWPVAAAWAKSRMDTAGWVKKWKILRDCTYKFLAYRQYICVPWIFQMKMISISHSSNNFSNYPAHGISSNTQVIHKYYTHQPSYITSTGKKKIPTLRGFALSHIFLILIDWVNPNLCFHPIYKGNQHRLWARLFHSISVPSSILGPS